MFNREWFRLFLLSLSLLFSPIKIQPAEAIIIWVAGNAIPIACGLAGSALGLKWKFDSDTKGLGIEETKKEIEKVEKQIGMFDGKKASENKGCGTAESRPKARDLKPEAVLGEWQKQLGGMTDEQLEKTAAMKEEIIEDAKSHRGYYKPGTKARIELEEHIEFYEKALKDTQTEKLAREKQRVEEEERKKNNGKKPKKPGDNGGPSIDVNEKDKPPHETGIEVEFVGKDKPGQHSHQWRDEGGHFIEDTPSARELIKKTIEEGNYRGVKNGKHQYDWINPETGEQIWAEVRNNKVQNHGLNLKPWEVNPESGFIEAAHDYVRPKHGVLRSVKGAEFLAKIKLETMSPTPKYEAARGCRYPKYDSDLRLLYYLKNKKTLSTKEQYKELIAIASSYHKTE